MFTVEGAQKVAEYVSKTGKSLNYIADEGIKDFFKTKQRIITENDARYKGYQGGKKDQRIEVFVSDTADVQLMIYKEEYRVSRSNLTAQAILYYISTY